MAIEKPVKLACGQVLRNRLAKSAMSENLAEKNLPGEKLCRLYETWGAGGLGLIITGNVMVDGDELGEPNNVVLDNDKDLDKFRAWTSAAKKNGAQIWAQINHPGDGETRKVGVDIPLIGLANDPQDGAIPGASLVWTSDLDGQIGTGTEFNAPLNTVGVHTVTLTATDIDGNEGTASLVLNME